MRNKNYSPIKSILLALFYTLVLYSGSSSAASDDALISTSVEISFADFDGTDDTYNDGELQPSVTGTKSYAQYSLVKSHYATNHHFGRKRLNANTVRGSPATVS
jgi:hypothetical protein